jgi:glycosyltransferase involved in cell wall biosynthesis
VVFDGRCSRPGSSGYARSIELPTVNLTFRMHINMEAPTCRLWRSSAASPAPPVPQWMSDAWAKADCPPLLGSQRYSVEAQALLWFVSDWYRKRKPYRFVLPPGLVDWLNAPEVDLSNVVRYRPGIEGPVLAHGPKPVSRLMYCIAEQHNRLTDFNCPEQYYEFLAWYALELMAEWNLPGALLPQFVIDLLNAPVYDDSTPVTVGMWLHLKRLGLVDNEIRHHNQISLLAKSFQALDAFVANGDPRLIPPTVSRFWSERPLDNRTLTAFEYVLARTHNATGASGLVDEPALRDWYHQKITAVSNGAYALFSGPPSLTPSTLDKVTWSIRDTAVLNYRDHHTVAGLSNSGKRALEALVESGLPAFDFSFHLGRTLLDEETKRNRAMWVNARRRLHLLNLNPEYVPDWYYCNLAHIGAEDYIIGQFFWELTRTSKIHEPGIRLVDEIWTASEYLSGIYAAETDRPIILMGHAIVPVEPLAPANRRQYKIGDNTFVFLSSFDAGSIVERKNPLGAILAFQAAFPRRTEDVALVIKTRNLEYLQTTRDREHWELVTARMANDPRIIVITETLSAESLAGLYRMSDCFVSLHRSEGFGQGPAEAMVHGKPVIVTNYSGVCDFCTAETAKLVGYDLIRIKPNEYPYLDADRVYYWADPDLKTAAAHMAELAADRQQAAQLGSAGRDVINRKYSVAAVHSRYIERLRRLGFE